MISIGQLVAGGIGPTQARLFAPLLTQTCDAFDICTPMRQAGFVAQCAHESDMFVHLEESLWYRDPARVMQMFKTVTTLEQAKTLVGKPQALASVVYAGRNGNGNETSDDGWRYRGRGLIQITGRNNYTAAAMKLAEPYVDQPDLVAQPADACLTAGWYWDRTGLNKLADAGSIDKITRAINGFAMAGAKERAALFRTFVNIFSAPPAAQP